MGAGRPVTLRDGARIRVRPIEPGDRDALRDGFERLSPESRYRRFFSPVRSLSDRDLDHLTRVDHHDHEALVALAGPDERLVAVARFVRTGPAEAEPAIVVADDWQGRGIAARMLDDLVERAREEGVEVFRTPVLASNTAAMRALRRLGPSTQTRVGREVEMEVSLTPEAEARPRLRELLRASAEGWLNPGLTVLQWLALRARPSAAGGERNAIVVGTDGSAGGEEAVRAAAELARAQRARLHIVRVCWPLLDDGEEAAADLRRAAADARADGADVEVEVRWGNAAAAVLDAAADARARLVVVGAPQRSGAARLLPGGVADVVARQAPCDVLIVRGAPA